MRSWPCTPARHPFVYCPESNTYHPHGKGGEHPPTQDVRKSPRPPPRTAGQAAEHIHVLGAVPGNCLKVGERAPPPPPPLPLLRLPLTPKLAVVYTKTGARRSAARQSLLDCVCPGAEPPAAAPDPAPGSSTRLRPRAQHSANQGCAYPPGGGGLICPPPPGPNHPPPGQTTPPPPKTKKIFLSGKMMF